MFIPGIHSRDDPESKNRLLYEAVPSVFPAHQPYKQNQRHSRSPPKKQPWINVPKLLTERQSAYLLLEHGYSKCPKYITKNLLETKQKLEDACKELKGLN